MNRRKFFGLLFSLPLLRRLKPQRDFPSIFGSVADRSAVTAMFGPGDTGYYVNFGEIGLFEFGPPAGYIDRQVLDNYERVTWQQWKEGRA